MKDGDTYCFQVQIPFSVVAMTYRFDAYVTHVCDLCFLCFLTLKKLDDHHFSFGISLG